MDGGDDLVSVVLRVGGQVDTSLEIERVETIRQLNRISYAYITLLDGAVADQTFRVSETSMFAPGAEVEVCLGYHGDVATVFKGLVVKHGVQVKRSRGSRLHVVCCDKAAAMTMTRRRRQFADEDDAATLTALIEGYGLQADVALTGGVYEQMTQYFASDWDYLLCRAEANGAIVMVDNDKVSVKPPDFAPAQIDCTFGANLIEVDIDVDARAQVTSITASGWDPAAQETVTGESNEPDWSGAGNISGMKLADVLGGLKAELRSTAALKETDLSAWASAKLMMSRLARMQGSCTALGNAGIVPGKTLELRGLGARFNGDVYVTSVRHVVELGVWRTEATVGMPPGGVTESGRGVSSPPAGGLGPGASGLQIGQVTKVDGDPSGQNRVRVTMPLLADDQSAMWMRLATGYASASAGHFFMPEIGDEVVVGFLDGDPNAPVVIGALYSSKRPGAYTPEETNSTKAIVTRSQMKLIFDEEAKSIALQTPGGHSLLMSDDEKAITFTDLSGNQLKMGPSGIELTSKSDVTIKAQASIALNAQADATMGASGDAKISGLNVNLAADLAFSAQGQAQAQLTADGEVTIQGAMVMIN